MADSASYLTAMDASRVVLGMAFVHMQALTVSIDSAAVWPHVVPAGCKRFEDATNDLTTKVSNSRPTPTAIPTWSWNTLLLPTLTRCGSQVKPSAQLPTCGLRLS